MIALKHDHNEVVVFVAEDVVHEDLNVIELVEGSGCGGRIAGFDLCRFDVIVSGDRGMKITEKPRSVWWGGRGEE